MTLPSYSSRTFSEFGGSDSLKGVPLPVGAVL